MAWAALGRRRGLPSTCAQTGNRRSLVLVACAVLVAANAAPGSGSRATQRQDFAYTAQAVGRTLHYEALLPAGYGTSGKRYPVIYFLHGLPANSVGYRDARFVEGALQELDRNAILIAPEASDEAETDPEYLDRGPGHNWETALTRELVTSVDTRLRTIPTPGRTGHRRAVGRRVRRDDARTATTRACTRPSSRGAATSIRRTRRATSRSISAAAPPTSMQAPTRRSGMRHEAGAGCRSPSISAPATRGS